jgi:hypothetical protein
MDVAGDAVCAAGQIAGCFEEQLNVVKSENRNPKSEGKPKSKIRSAYGSWATNPGLWDFPKGWLLALALCFAAGSLINRARADDAKPLYQNNFESNDVGKVPDDFLVLDGAFAVQQEDGNKYLELPGAPLDTFGALFGPTEKSDWAVTARIRGTSKGRRHPTFGVGLDGQGGYRLQLSPGKGALELYKRDAVVASVPYEWKSGQWTTLRLQVVKAGAAWKVEGKAWAQGTSEPEKPSVSFDETTEPPSGRAAIWGSPFSTTPIQFDDLVVTRVAPKS